MAEVVDLGERRAAIEQKKQTVAISAEDLPFDPAIVMDDIQDLVAHTGQQLNDTLFFLGYDTEDSEFAVLFGLAMSLVMAGLCRLSEIDYPLPASIQDEINRLESTIPPTG